MNPNSSYYLAINIGFPNAYDRANGRTGDFLMIHGDCSSRGCYAMTDEQIAEIYALARESFFGGQRAFQIQAYPFRMTPLNMAKHRNSPHMAFWRMLKKGYDHFEVTRLEPKVDVCEKRYVFDAESQRPLHRRPASARPTRCSQDIVAAVAEKQKRDDRQMAELRQPRHADRAGAHAHRRRHASDLPGRVPEARTRTRPASSARRACRLPGTIPAHAVPPRDPVTLDATGSTALSRRCVGQAIPARRAICSAGLFASNNTEPPSSDGMFDRVSRFVGWKGSDPAPAEPTSAQKKKSQPKATQTAATTPKATAPKASATSSASTATTSNAGAIRPAAPKAPPAPTPEAKPDAGQETKAAAAAEARPSSGASALNGAQPTVPTTGSFSNRWGF